MGDIPAPVWALWQTPLPWIFFRKRLTFSVEYDRVSPMVPSVAHGEYSPVNSMIVSLGRKMLDKTFRANKHPSGRIFPRKQFDAWC